MSSTETTSFGNLAQRLVAANDASLSFPNMALAPLVEVLAKMGLMNTKPRALSILSKPISPAIIKGIEINTQVGALVLENAPKAANDTTYNNVVQLPMKNDQEALKKAA